MQQRKIVDPTEILNVIEEIAPIIADHSRVGHLFSNDQGVKSLAKLNQQIGRLRTLLRMQGLKSVLWHSQDFFSPSTDGRPVYVSVRPVDPKHEGKTFFGILIGEVATGVTFKMKDEETGELSLVGPNPCIYIPALGTVVFGYNSWWSEIQSEDDLKQITDEVIDKTWYVQLAKRMDIPPAEETASNGL